MLVSYRFAMAIIDRSQFPLSTERTSKTQHGSQWRRVFYKIAFVWKKVKVENLLLTL